MPVKVAKSSAAERRERNRSIAAARADGEDWTSIAYCHGISERQARRAAQDARQLAAEEDWRSRMSLIGEMLGLRWGDVHLGDDPGLTVDDQVYRGERRRLKTANAYRTIPLSPGMARALAAWRERTSHPGDADPLFASVAGTPLDYANVCKRVWVPARDAAGIDGSEVGAFHAFRHTLGSLIHERGAKSDRQLCDWLGHHDPAFTVREYVGTMDDGLGEADFLDELIPVEVWGAGR